MAIRYATKTGVWSDPTVWDGGTLPDPTDDVYASNKTVTVDMNVTVNSFNTIPNVGLSIASGGQFRIRSSVTVVSTTGLLTTNIASGGSAGTFNISGTGLTVVLTFGGHVDGKGANPARTIVTEGSFAGSTLTINANNLRTTENNGGSTVLYVNSTGGEINLYIQGLFANYGNTIRLVASATTLIHVRTDITVGGNASAGGCIGAENYAGVIHFHGTVTQSIPQANALYIISSSSAANIQVVAHALWQSAASGSSVQGMVAGTSGNFVITFKGGLRGALDAGYFNPVVRVNEQMSHIIRIQGDIYLSGIGPGGEGAIGWFPIQGPWGVVAGEDVRLHVKDDSALPSLDGATRVLSLYGSDLPATEDVRQGTAYGPADTLEGTLAVPPVEAVMAGVPVDDTVGTAALSLVDIASVTGAQIAAAG